MFTGADKGITSPDPAKTPYSSYRYNAMRWDPGSGQYDMGFRNYDPGLNSFLSRDMYNGALADVALTTDPFTGSRYAFGDGNPISNIELDGHMFPAGGGAAGCPYGTIGCLGYHPPSTSSGGGNQPNCWEGSYCVPQPQLPPGWSFQRSGPWAGVVTHTWQQRECSPGGARTGAPFCWTQTNQEQFNVGTVCGGGARTGAPHCYPASEFLTPSQGTDVFWAIITTAGSAALGSILDALDVGVAAEDAGAAAGRLPQDIAVNPNPPRALPLNRPISASPTQNAFLQNRIAQLQQLGANAFRVNQQQVDINGVRVGINRPDLQYTLNGQRFYEEFDTSSLQDALLHEPRIMANDPSGVFIPWYVP